MIFLKVIIDIRTKKYFFSNDFLLYSADQGTWITSCFYHFLGTGVVPLAVKDVKKI